MRGLAESLGLAPQVVWTGHRDDIAAVLSAVDVVACPSHREPFSLVALEALAAGRPVVATTAGGLPEVVNDGVTGLVVPARDPRRLAAAWSRCWAIPIGAGGWAGRLPRARRTLSAARRVPRISPCSVAP
jgi:glycosyltransferase involved in cell wall biosynthesis